MTRPIVPTVCVLAFAGCSGASPAQLESDAQRAVKGFITEELKHLSGAAQELAAAAPAPDADGWSAQADRAAVEAMRAAWRKTRAAYERIEGAIAVLFPDIDESIDARYDGFIATGGDANLFDGEGVTGMHAIERILWSDAVPPAVLDFESKLSGYVAPAFPRTLEEATAFRDGLVARLVDDAARMERDFAPLALDSATAFRGVIGSMEEQLEKVELAATAEEESRYAQHTLGDMRANLEGAERTFAAFRPWLAAVATDPTLVEKIEAGFAALESAYGAMPGDAIPPVPAGWNPDAPGAEALATPYGKLRALLVAQCDPKEAASVVALMSQAADALGIPTLPE